MNLFWIFGAWMLVAGLTSVLLLAAGVHFFGDDPLRMLDGRTLASVLDDRARAPRVRAHLEADRAPDLFAHALEEIRNLPTASGH